MRVPYDRAADPAPVPPTWRQRLIAFVLPFETDAGSSRSTHATALLPGTSLMLTSWRCSWAETCLRTTQTTRAALLLCSSASRQQGVRCMPSAPSILAVPY